MVEYLLRASSSTFVLPLEENDQQNQKKESKNIGQ